MSYVLAVLALIAIGLAFRILYLQGNRIMSAISDFAAKQQAFNDDIAADLTAIQSDIAALNATIATLQNSSGQISAEDQATLDDLQAKGAALAAQADATAGKTPPAPPAG